MASRLVWRGNQVQADVEQGLAAGLAEFGLRCEAAAKKRLQPGHGVKTGTLRRSIHTATPGYTWAGDDVLPSPSTPERGGQETSPAERGGKLTLELGSGMEYAMAVHQGHGDFSGYHFLTEAVAEEAPRLPAILKRHVGGKVG